MRAKQPIFNYLLPLPPNPSQTNTHTRAEKRTVNPSSPRGSRPGRRSARRSPAGGTPTLPPPAPHQRTAPTLPLPVEQGCSFPPRQFGHREKAKEEEERHESVGERGGIGEGQQGPDEGISVAAAGRNLPRYLCGSAGRCVCSRAPSRNSASWTARRAGGRRQTGGRLRSPLGPRTARGWPG